MKAFFIQETELMFKRALSPVEWIKKIDLKENSKKNRILKENSYKPTKNRSWGTFFVKCVFIENW